MDAMERLDVSEIVKVLGSGPCSTDACPNTGRRVLLFGSLEVVEPCVSCQQAAAAERDDEERAERLAARLRGAGSTPLYLDWTLESFAATRTDEAALAFAWEWIDRYVAGERINAFIYGPQGGGKTGLAWSMIRHLVTEGDVGCKIATWREALDVMRDSFRHSEPSRQMERLRAVPVLVLDDVGSERPTDFARSELLSLVDRRMLNKRPTIITSNFDQNSLADRLGHDDSIIGRRIVSRMCGGGTMQLHLDVPDRRLAA